MVNLVMTQKSRVLTFKGKKFSDESQDFSIQIKELHPEWLNNDVEEALDTLSWSNDSNEIIQALKVLWLHESHKHLLVMI